MIRAIAAIDRFGGVADNHRIPWKIPADQLYFRAQTKDQEIIMGYNTYLMRMRPLQHRRNFVLCEPNSILRDGFEPVYDLADFFAAHKDVWVIGGAGLYALAFDYCQELYITKVLGDFHCTKFFPEYATKFAVKHESKPQHHGDLEFVHQVWSRFSQ